jgi:hypothetical protein
VHPSDETLESSPWVVAAVFHRRAAGTRQNTAPGQLTQNLYCAHLPTSFKLFRWERNRKKSKFERKGLVSTVSPPRYHHAVEACDGEYQTLFGSPQQAKRARPIEDKKLLKEQKHQQHRLA